MGFCGVFPQPFSRRIIVSKTFPDTEDIPKVSQIVRLVVSLYILLPDVMSFYGLKLPKMALLALNHMQKLYNRATDRRIFRTFRKALETIILRESG